MHVGNEFKKAAKLGKITFLSLELYNYTEQMK